MPERHSRLSRWFDFIAVLSDGNGLTAAELTTQLNISLSNVYYILKSLAGLGFVIDEIDNRFFLNTHSPFLERIHHTKVLSQEEASYVYEELATYGRRNAQTSKVLRKIKSNYQLENTDLIHGGIQTRTNAQVLKSAISSKRVCRLVSYASAHSRQTSDRVVEPFLMLNGGKEVRAYDFRARDNRTFKISRIGRVELEDCYWMKEEEHDAPFTDLFAFTGFEHHKVTLRLGYLAHSLLMEEYPVSRTSVIDTDGNTWTVELDVADYRGVGRFVIGLYDDIDILGNEDFKRYIHERIERMRKKEAINED